MALPRTPIKSQPIKYGIDPEGDWFKVTEGNPCDPDSKVLATIHDGHDAELYVAILNNRHYRIQPMGLGVHAVIDKADGRVLANFNGGTEPASIFIAALLTRSLVDHPDDPQMDCTDAAHPAWWRGQEHGVHTLCCKIQDILDGKDDGSGVASPPWEGIRRRLLSLVKKGLKHEHSNSATEHADQ